MSSILYFTRDYTTHDRRFLVALAGTEHKVYYLRLERGEQQLEDRPLPPKIEMVHWAGGGKPVHPKDVLRLLGDLKRVIREVKPDLVHAGPIQSSALLAAMTGFRPLVSMSWGSDLLWDAERNSWYGWATRYTLKHSDVLIGDCKPVRQKAIAFGMPDEKIVTFPWGVDLKHFTPDGQAGRLPSVNFRKGVEKDDIFVLLSTRGWEPVYGVDIIAKAFVLAAQQAAARSYPELHLIMLGGGSQATLLRQIFLKGGVQEQVHFPGQVSQNDLPDYYRSVDLYVSASHSDGTSISLLEAMACGRPVLVSDIPGNREWVEPGVQGWWFPDGSANALAQGILCAVEARDRSGEMGQAARRLVEERADWECNFKHLLGAYEMAKGISR